MPQRHAAVRSMVKEEVEDYDDDYDEEDDYDEDDDYEKAPAPAAKPKLPPAPAKKPQQPQAKQPQQQPKQPQQSQKKAPASPGKQALKKPDHSKLIEDVSGMKLGDEQEIEERVEETARTATHAQLQQTMQRRGSRASEVTRILAQRAVSSKQTLNLVVIGHVDAGKSTTMGHLLYLLGGVSQRAMHKLEQESARIGKGSFAYAWVLDEQAEERARGVTIDVGVTAFETPKLNVTLLDAPGHRDFVPNMISGAAQADAAVLVINAVSGEFETGFSGGGQTREHAAVARGLGVRQLIVAVNQMDRVSWSQTRFDEVRGILEPFLKKTGYVDPIFVPCSGLSGENLVERKDPVLSAWYSGPTLLGAIDSCHPAERPVDTPLRLCVGDVYKTANATGVSVGGKIEAGSVAVGDRVLVLPANMLATVRSVARGQQPIEVAVAGENVEISLTGVDSAFVSVGSVVCDPAKPCILATKFRAKILTLTLDTPLLPGQQCVAYCQNASSAATLSRLVAVLDAATAAVLRRSPRCVGENQAVDAEVTLERPLCVELHTTLKSLGRFTLRAGGRTIAVGVVTQVL